MISSMHLRHLFRALCRQCVYLIGIPSANKDNTFNSYVISFLHKFSLPFHQEASEWRDEPVGEKRAVALVFFRPAQVQASDIWLHR